MSATFHCDGCDAQIDEPIIVGHVTKREYCAPCAEKAREFVTAEEELRKYTHEKFVDARAVLIATHSAGGFKLPDTV